ncbi:MAG: PPC domain-containing protein [Roseibacillus sp.]|nr:PPC domain-containing protein [Roseibacillus sp.]
MFPRIIPPVISAILLLFIPSGGLLAQKAAPVLESIFPAGGQAGQSIDVTISGEELEGATGLVFATEEHGFTIETEALPSTTSPENPNQFRIKIPESAKAGRYGVHVRCAQGLSSPRGFVVGTKPEVTESGINSMKDRAMQISVETTINGRAEESASDFYQVDLEAGDTIRIRCHSEALASRLSASLTLSGPDGAELDRDRDNSDRDAMVAGTATATGPYFIQVSDFTFRGGPAYTYRLEVAKGPQILFAYPAAGEMGKTTTHLLYGRNLPGSDPSRRIHLGGRLVDVVEAQISIDSLETFELSTRVRQSMIPAKSYRLMDGTTASNVMPLGIATAPMILETETGPGGDAQSVQIPCEIQGRFDRTRDVDRYQFEAKKGETLWIEALAQRIGTTVDATLVVERLTPNLESGGTVQQVGTADDLSDDTGERRFPLPCGDAALPFTAPENGTYRIIIMNLAGRGGIDQVYRLAIKTPSPGFELVAIPWRPVHIKNEVDILTPALSPGGRGEIRVFALRQGGYEGDIELLVEGLPQGIHCSPVSMGKGRDSTLTLTVDPEMSPWYGFITIHGTGEGHSTLARIGMLLHRARDFSKESYSTALAPSLPLSVSASPNPLSIQIPKQKTFELPAEGALEIPVTIQRHSHQGEVVLKAEGLPGKIPELKIPSGSSSGTFLVPAEVRAQLPEGTTDQSFQLTTEISFQHKPGPAAVLYARAEQTQLKTEERTLKERIESLNPASPAGTKAEIEAVEAARRLPALRSAIQATADRLKVIAERTRASSRKIRASSGPLTMTVGP